MQCDRIVPDWPAPAGVRALVTTRVPDATPFGAFNLAAHVGDDAARVRANRARLAEELGVELGWLTQVHGTDVAELRTVDGGGTPRADAAWTRTRGLACGILVADCLPVLLCARDASCVSAAHCGWRGLADGVLAALVAAIPVGADSLLAWIGPGIGASRYEVGSEVVERVRSRWGGDAVGVAFRSSGLRASTHADLEALARFELRALGITDIHGGGFCTARDPRFYSYRRDGVTGRMAALVWRS